MKRGEKSKKIRKAEQEAAIPLQVGPLVRQKQPPRLVAAASDSNRWPELTIEGTTKEINSPSRVLDSGTVDI